MKILVIRFSAIGDILLTFPVVEALQHKYPGSEIHFLTKPSNKPVLELLSSKVQHRFLQESLVQTATQLRSEGYDLVIDLHNNLRTFLLQVLMLKGSWNRFRKLNFQKWLLTSLKWNTLPKVHLVERYAQAAKVNPTSVTLGLNNANLVVESLPSNYVAWVLGATFSTKQYPLSKLIETIERLEMPIVLLGGEKENTLANSLQAHFPSLISLVGKTSLAEAALVLSKAKVVVTNDTGLMHLAAFYEKPMVCIWGNTVPDFGMYPYQSTPVFHAQVRDLSCRPCSKIGHNTCPKGHFDCMLKQQTVEISEQITALFYQEK
ncbi:MAG: glycosyltransferase family 9 protein [Flavobacteriales bacterium]